MNAPGAANPLMISPVTPSGLNQSIMGRSLSRHHSCYHTDLARRRHQDRSTSSPFFVQLIEGLRPKQDRGNATCSLVPSVGGRIGRRGQSGQGVIIKGQYTPDVALSEERGGGRQARRTLSTNRPESWVGTLERRARVNSMGVRVDERSRKMQGCSSPVTMGPIRIPSPSSAFTLSTDACPLYYGML